MTDQDSYTQDTISLRSAGIVRITQKKKGARFNLDSLLLADFCTLRAWDRVLEPGTGTGVISLLLAAKHPRSQIVAVEVQTSLARICRRNIHENHFGNRITLLEQDIRKLRAELKAETFDVIVANPPYTKTGTGRESPSPERLSSRQERLGGIGAWLDLHRFLKNRGRYVLVFPADRLAELTSELRSRNLEPKRMRLVFPFQDKPASLVLLESVKAGGIGLRILPPLVVHEVPGRYTGEMKQIYGIPPG